MPLSPTQLAAMDLLLASLKLVTLGGEATWTTHPLVDRPIPRPWTSRKAADKEPENTYGLPTGKPLAAKLRSWMDKQRKEVLGTVPPTLVDLPTHFPSLTDYDDPMARAMTPVLASYWDESGRETRARLGLDPDSWEVVNPKTRAKIEGQALNFCRATNETTSKSLQEALATLRAELVAGIVTKGESLDELTARVNAVFDKAERWRARRIAATEASRAVHAAQYESAVESGVVAGFEWLLSGDACPLCQMVATQCRMVPAGRAFAEVGDNPAYSRIQHPPLHPSCQCAMIEVLTPAYGGPEDPAWSETLDQPDPGESYTPPAGEKVPKPDPEAFDK